MRENVIARLHGARAARWLVLLWLALVYVWARYGEGPTIHDIPLLGSLPVGGIVPADRLFTGLMLLHAALYGVSLATTLRGRGRIVYVGAQGLLVVIVALTLSNRSLVMALFLALTVDAIILLQRPRPVVVAVSVYLALFLLACALQLIHAVSTNGRETTAVGDVVLFVVGVASFVVLYSQRAYAYERSQVLVNDLESAHAQLAASAARIEELTLLAERQRIARELHDTVTQGIAGLIMQLEATDARLAAHDPARAREIVQQAMVRARSAFTAARHAIEGLRDGEGRPASLIDAVQDEIAHFGAETRIACESDLEGLAHLPPALHDPILRVIGEGLVNIARHARARQAWVCVARRAETVEVEVRDDGVGFNPVAMAARGHYGLLGVRERARLAGGSLEVISGADQGSVLRLSLPYVPAPKLERSCADKSVGGAYA